MKILTRKRPSWRHDGIIDVLSERARRTRRHLHLDGLTSECETKNNLSTESIMLVMSALIGGMGCGITQATLVGGGLVYVMPMEITFMDNGGKHNLYYVNL